MEVLGPATPSLSNDEIIATYPKGIDELIKAATDPNYDFERQIYINQARLNWQFIRGNHFNVPGMTTTPFGQIADYVPFDGLNDGEITGPDVKLCPPINVIGGDCFKYMAVMGMSSPNVKGVADDAKDSQSLDQAHNADVNIRDLWTKNKINRRWVVPAFHQYATGPCFLRAVWRTDASKYGSSEEPVLELQDGAPVQTGTTQYANGDAEVEMFSILEVSIPWGAKDLTDWLKLERMQSKWALLDAYKGAPGEDGQPGPGPLDKYRDGDLPDDDLSASTATAAEAREAVDNPSGTGRSKKPNSWRHCEWWIPPYLYEAATDEEFRKVLRTQFPNGLYIARVGSITVKLDHRKSTEEWCVVRVNRGETIMERPICSDGLPIQRALNDLNGMAIETILRAVTQTIMDSQLIDREAMNTKEAVPAEIILTALPVDGDLGKLIFQIPPAHLSDQALPMFAALRALMQDITGVRPEMTGGGPPTQTYAEAKMRRDQALAQLSPQANAMLYAAADLAENLVKLRAKFGAGTVKAQQETAYGIETDVVDISQLSESGWHAEYSSNFPMSLSDERDATISLLKDMPPQVQQALGILDPLNIGHFCQLLGVPGFESALREQQQKTIEDISKLVQGSPIPVPPGAPPAPPMPSIPIDPFDNHAIVAGIMAAWMISERQGGKTRATNPNGFANVLAAWQAHTAAATPPPPPPPPALKGSLSLAAKLEDFPGILNEALQAAGVNAPPGIPGVKPPPPPGAPGPPPPGALPDPGPIGAQPMPPPGLPAPPPLPVM
jgi:hypothetical protein